MQSVSITEAQHSTILSLMYLRFHVTCLLHLSDLTKIMKCWQILVKIQNVNFCENLFHVGRWLDGQTWQGSQPISAIASYLHLTTCDLFFQNHVILNPDKYISNHNYSKLPHHPPCHIRVMPPQLFLYVLKRVKSASWMGCTPSGI